MQIIKREIREGQGEWKALPMATRYNAAWNAARALEHVKRAMQGGAPVALRTHYIDRAGTARAIVARY